MTVLSYYYFIRKRQQGLGTTRCAAPPKSKLKKGTVNTTRSNFLCDLPFRQNEPRVLIDN